MISRVCYCFRLSRVSYSLYCNKLSVHNISPPLDWKSSLLLTLLSVYVSECHVCYLIQVRMSTCVRRMLLNPTVFGIVFPLWNIRLHCIYVKACTINNTFTLFSLDSMRQAVIT